MQDSAGQPFRVGATRVLPGTDEELIWPIEVGSIGAQAPGGADREPTLMIVTIDIDSVAGLRGAFERHSGGVALDVKTQWHMATIDDVEYSPLAFLRVTVQDPELSFLVAFEVDEVKRSLAVAARTGMVILLEPQLSEALRHRDMREAFSEHLSIGLSVPGVEPLQRALAQRFDLPLTESFGHRQAIAPEDVESALDDFLAGSHPGGSFVVVPVAGAPPIVILGDQAAASATAGVSEPRRAHWSSVIAGPHSIARLDLLASDKQIWAWAWPDPPSELVRATSSGPHWVVVVPDDLSSFETSDSEGRRRLVEKLSRVDAFAVDEAPEAMRALMRDPLGEP